MKIPLLWLCLVASAYAVHAQTQSRLKTVVARSYATTNEAGALEWRPGSARIVVPFGESGKIAAINSSPGRREYRVGFWKEGFWFYSYQPNEIGNGIFAVRNDHSVEGPVTFELLLPEVVTGPSAAMLTLEIFPVAFDPGKTLIVPQGSNAVAVAMEWSTNLVAWSIATNGVYGTADAAKFFRVKASPALP